MKLKRIYSRFAFSRNPLVVISGGNLQASGSSLGELSLRVGESPDFAYRGKFTPPLSIDVSEIVDACIPAIKELSPDNVEPLVQIEAFNELRERRVEVLYELPGKDSETLDFYALPGGISKQNLRRYDAMHTDAMAARFLRTRGNFFLTTRTSSWLITIKETELMPLYFLTESDGLEIRIVEETRGQELLLPVTGCGIWALDVAALRQRFVDEHNVWSSMFSIYFGHVFSCRIIITLAQPALERYRLKFRNSLGVFDVIDIEGELNVEASFGSDDDAELFGRYDEVVGDFCNERSRVERNLVLTGSTGIKLPAELPLLMDMLASDEVYLLDLSPLPVKVIPSVDDFSYKTLQKGPQSFALRLEPVEADKHIMQDIITGTELVRQRIFIDQFSKQFN